MNIVVHFCDRCSASIPDRDVAEKVAFIHGGLRLCSTCRRALGGGTGDPEIFFCEGCGRSISVPDLEIGSFSVTSGRLLCGTCRPPAAPAPVPPAAAASAEPASVSAARRGGSGLAVLAVLALLAAGSSGVALFVPGVRAVLEARGFVSRGPAAASDEERATASAPAATPAEIRDLRGSVESLAQSVRALTERSAAPDATDRLAALEASLLEAVRRDSDSLANLEVAIGDVRELVGELRGEIDAVKMLASLPGPDADGAAVDPSAEETPQAPAEPKPSTSSELPPGESSASPERDRWIAELSAGDSGRRFTAIVELARLRDPAAIPELGKSLASDPDVYCRTEAGRTLGELRAMAAVPFLIAALRDRENMVVVTAAESLKLITSKSFGFTAKSSPQDRREAISRWESWWEKNKDSLLGPGGSKH